MASPWAIHKTRAFSSAPIRMVLSNDLAALVGFASEAVLWGIYSVLFTASLVLLIRRVPTRGLNTPILVLGCVLFASCTSHFALEFYHFVTTLRDTGAKGYANETPQLVGADILISLSDLLGDFVLLYRCWIIWGRNYWVILLPFFTAVAGFSCIMELVHIVVTFDPNAPVAPAALVPLGLAGYALPLATNVLTTMLIVARLWHTAHAADERCRGRLAGTARAAQHAVAIIVESGMLYLAAQLVLVVLFALGHPAQAVVAVMAVQFYGIAPTLIVIRVALGISSDFTTRDAPALVVPALTQVSWESPASCEYTRPSNLPGSHSFVATEESGPTLGADPEYLEMKAFDDDDFGQHDLAVAWRLKGLPSHHGTSTHSLRGPSLAPKLILGHILEAPRPSDIVFLQEVTRDVRVALLLDARVRTAFLATDAEDETAFENVPFATMTLLSNARFASGLEAPQGPAAGAEGGSKIVLGRVSRMPLPSKYGRDALCVEVVHPGARGTILRLINVHLDSLWDTLHYRTQQLEILSDVLREPGYGGGMIAGDFNAISRGDDALVDKNGLVDAWVALRGSTDPAGGTWCVGVRRRPARLDKVAMVGLKAEETEVLRPGVIEVPRPGEESLEIPWSDRCGLRCTFTI
ncbi:hypothetical protein VTO73DRAFT_10849 [Trametes versicolor]